MIMLSSNWEAIPGFVTPGEYRRFVEFIERQVATGEAIELPVDAKYGPGLVFGGRWFREVSSGEVWRLIPPDPPFAGLWEPVRKE